MLFNLYSLNLCFISWLLFPPFSSIFLNTFKNTSAQQFETLMYLHTVIYKALCVINAGPQEVKEKWSLWRMPTGLELMRMNESDIILSVVVVLIVTKCMTTCFFLPLFPRDFLFFGVWKCESQPWLAFCSQHLRGMDKITLQLFSRTLLKLKHAHTLWHNTNPYPIPYQNQF